MKYNPELEGKPVTLLYLPTAKSRKWRKAWFIRSYTEDVAVKDANTIQEQENWHDIKYVEGCQL